MAMNPSPRGGFSPRGRGRGGAAAGRDPLVNKTIKIRKGMWKGYLGIVKDTTETHARVELHTNNRTVTVPKSDINDAAAQDETRGPSYNNAFGERYGAFDGGKTPAYEPGSNATPAWNPESRTPAWDAGSKTPAWDSGSKTPAWEAGSATPAHDAYGGDNWSGA